MRAALYDCAAPGGIRIAEQVAKPCLSHFNGNRVLINVKAVGINPVDAKYIIGDKLPESWMDWVKSRVSGVQVSTVI
jgi:NADPH:quinone reductase-like Zn-dependent oxidoreductase